MNGNYLYLQFDETGLPSERKEGRKEVGKGKRKRF